MSSRFIWLITLLVGEWTYVKSASIVILKSYICRDKRVENMNIVNIEMRKVANFFHVSIVLENLARKIHT